MVLHRRITTRDLQIAECVANAERCEMSFENGFVMVAASEDRGDPAAPMDRKETTARAMDDDRDLGSRDILKPYKTIKPPYRIRIRRWGSLFSA